MSKQFGFKEVMDLDFFNYTTNTALLSVDYAMDTSIDSKASRLDLSGGQGNYKLMSFDHTKTMDFKCTLPLVDLTMLSQLAGKGLTTETIVTLQKREVLSASATNTITLTNVAPKVGSLQVFLLSGTRDLDVVQVVGTPATVPNNYSILAGVITLNATTAPVGTQFVVYYDYLSTDTVSQVTFTANNFPDYMHVIGHGLATDEQSGEVVKMLFDIKKCKMQSNFSLTLSSTKATELILTFDCYCVDIPNLVTNGMDKVYCLMTEEV